jgi:uncharacterized membrane protein
MHFLQNPLFLISTSTGIVFIITSFVISKYPPKKINMIYGYRTKSSMKSKERWDFAQNYSADLLYKYGMLLTLIGLFSYFTSFPTITATIISLVIMSILLFILVYKTEKAIKERFGNGK